MLLQLECSPMRYPSQHSDTVQHQIPSDVNTTLCRHLLAVYTVFQLIPSHVEHSPYSNNSACDINMDSI